LQLEQIGFPSAQEHKEQSRDVQKSRKRQVRRQERSFQAAELVFPPRPSPWGACSRTQACSELLLSSLLLSVSLCDPDRPSIRTSALGACRIIPTSRQLGVAPYEPSLTKTGALQVSLISHARALAPAGTSQSARFSRRSRTDVACSRAKHTFTVMLYVASAQPATAQLGAFKCDFLVSGSPALVVK
jgi:hypothetical protein